MQQVIPKVNKKVSLEYFINVAIHAGTDLANTSPPFGITNACSTKGSSG